jgi:hypothetical protein
MNVTCLAQVARFLRNVPAMVDAAEEVLPTGTATGRLAALGSCSG